MTAHNYTIFRNKGLIDMRAIKTFGASVKKTDNPIGMFGTGLKYAIAICLRNGYDFSLYRGKTCRKFEARKQKMRGETIEFIAMAGDDLGFTTELGKFWLPWQAFRELYCNAMDEDEGEVFTGTEADAAGKTGYTTIVVEGEDFCQLFQERWKYFLNPGLSKVHETHSVEIYDDRRDCVFFKGVRATWALLEEFIHLRQEVADETREMQNFLFTTILSQGERLLGRPLGKQRHISQLRRVKEHLSSPRFYQVMGLSTILLQRAAIDTRQSP